LLAGEESGRRLFPKAEGVKYFVNRWK